MTLARYTLIVGGVLGATLVPALLVLGARLSVEERWATGFGGALAGLNALAAYGLVRWGERRSQRAFFAAVLGGMVGRMGLLLVVVVAGILGLGLPRLPLAFTLLAYFVAFLALELALLQRRTPAEETR